MRDIAARICRDYLTGAWKTISADEIQLKKISGGLSNFLFYVSLPNGNTSPGSNAKANEMAPIAKRARKDSFQEMYEPKEVRFLFFASNIASQIYYVFFRLFSAGAFTNLWTISSRRSGIRINGDGVCCFYITFGTKIRT